jgi:hypothetical protein
VADVNDSITEGSVNRSERSLAKDLDISYKFGMLTKDE